MSLDDVLISAYFCMSSLRVYLEAVIEGLDVLEAVGPLAS